MVTTSQGLFAPLGLPPAAETAVSVLMMLTDVCDASQALICSSMTLAWLSMKILICSGVGILLARQKPATVPCRSYWSARSILAVTISPTLIGRRLDR